MAAGEGPNAAHQPWPHSCCGFAGFQLLKTNQVISIEKSGEMLQSRSKHLPRPRSQGQLRLALRVPLEIKQVAPDFSPRLPSFLFVSLAWVLGAPSWLTGSGIPFGTRPAVSACYASPLVANFLAICWMAVLTVELMIAECLSVLGVWLAHGRCYPFYRYWAESPFSLAPGRQKAVGQLHLSITTAGLNRAGDPQALTLHLDDS